MEFVRTCWTSEDYVAFKEYLEQIKEEGFQQFHKKLVPGEDKILGIRIPKLREIAKEILKGDPVSFLEVVENTYNEEKIIHGLVIGGLKEKEYSYESILSYIRNFIPCITNWSVCDCFCSSLKITNKHKEEMFSFLSDYVKSDKVYDIRFAMVMYLDYYLSPEYLEQVFIYCDQCKVEEYYVQMAVAWLISVAFVKEEAMTRDYLMKNELDDFTYNKALQKIVESNRVSKEVKEEIKKLKRR